MQSLKSRESRSISLSVVTVTAFESERLRRTLKSLVGLSSAIESVIVAPKDDHFSGVIAHEILGNTPISLTEVIDDHKGIYPAMNKGIESAHGKYILFLNAGDEVLDPLLLLANVEAINEIQPEWAILGCLLDSEVAYSTYSPMALRFLRQEPGSYVSHQSVVVRKTAIQNLGKFNTRLTIAADTHMTMKLTQKFSPLLLDGIAIKVEKGATVTKSNRRSRFETIFAVLLSGRSTNQFVALINILVKEVNFLLRKLKKSYYVCKGRL